MFYSYLFFYEYDFLIYPNLYELLICKLDLRNMGNGARCEGCSHAILVHVARHSHWLL